MLTLGRHELTELTERHWRERRRWLTERHWQLDEIQKNPSPEKLARLILNGAMEIKGLHVSDSVTDDLYFWETSATRPASRWGYQDGLPSHSDAYNEILQDMPKDRHGNPVRPKIKTKDGQHLSFEPFTIYLAIDEILHIWAGDLSGVLQKRLLVLLRKTTALGVKYDIVVDPI